MRIKFNHEYITLNEKSTLEEVLTLFPYTENLFSIAINRQFIPKKKYSETILTEGDIVEFFTAMQGG